jgi:hypothetical protein
VLDDVPERLGALNSGDSTNDTTPTLNGTAEPGSTVTIRLDGADLITIPIDGSGTWTYTLPRRLAKVLIPLPSSPPTRRVTPASRQTTSP